MSEAQKYKNLHNKLLSSNNNAAQAKQNLQH